MTRWLRPPVPLQVQCEPDGRPARLRRAGRDRTVTHIGDTWVLPAAWWDDGGPLCAERTYYRIVLDGMVVYQVFHAADQWYLERVVD